MTTLEQQVENNFQEWLAEQDIPIEYAGAQDWLRRAFRDAYLAGYSDGEHGV